MIFNPANLLTFARIICSIILIFLTPFSAAFHALYILAGLTDMADGTVARKLGTVSEFGSRLDTAADIIFTSVCLYKLIPTMQIPAWLLICTAAVAVVKLTTITYGWISCGRLVSEHTALNKITGLLLFLLPLTYSIIPLEATGTVVCTAALAAAVQETILVLRKR